MLPQKRMMGTLKIKKLLMHILFAAASHVAVVDGVRLTLNVGAGLKRLEIGTRHFVSINATGETGTTSEIKSPFSVQWKDHITRSFAYAHDTVSLHAHGDADVFVPLDCDQFSFEHFDGFLVVAGHNRTGEGWGCHLMISDEICDAIVDSSQNSPEYNYQAMHIARESASQIIPSEDVDEEEIINGLSNCVGGSLKEYSEILLSDDPILGGHGYELNGLGFVTLGRNEYTRYSTGWPEMREVELIRGDDLAFVSSPSSTTQVPITGPLSIIVEGSVKSMKCMDRWRPETPRPCLCIVTTDLLTCSSRTILFVEIQGVFVVTEGEVTLSANVPLFVKGGEEGDYSRYDRAITPHIPVTPFVTNVLKRDADFLLRISDAHKHEINEFKDGPEVPEALEVVPAPNLSIQAVTSILEFFLKMVGLLTTYIGVRLMNNLTAFLVLRGDGQTYYGGIRGNIVPSNSAWVTLVLAGALAGTDIAAPLAVIEKEDEPVVFSEETVAAGSFFGLQCGVGEVTITSTKIAAAKGFYGLDADASWPEGTCKAYYVPITTVNEYGTVHMSTVKRVNLRSVDECFADVEDSEDGCAVSSCAYASKYNMTLQVVLTDRCDKFQVEQIETLPVSTDTDTAIDTAIVTGLQATLRAISVVDTVVYTRSKSSAYEISWWVLALSVGLLASVLVLWFVTRPSVSIYPPETLREALIMSRRLAAGTGCNEPYDERPVTLGLSLIDEGYMNLGLTDKPEAYQKGFTIE